jgi:DNA-binding response OmpR family regulator
LGEQKVVNILLVEDDELGRYAIAKVLRKAGHVVVETVDGEGAMQAIKKKLPDILITDVVLPNYDGLSLLADVRKISASLPILVISGGGSNFGTDYLTFAEGLGANAVLKKPFLNSDLLNKVQAVLNPKA